MESSKQQQSLFSDASFSFTYVAPATSGQSSQPGTSTKRGVNAETNTTEIKYRDAHFGTLVDNRSACVSSTYL